MFKNMYEVLSQYVFDVLNILWACRSTESGWENDREKEQAWKHIFMRHTHVLPPFLRLILLLYFGKLF